MKKWAPYLEAMHEDYSSPYRNALMSPPRKETPFADEADFYETEEGMALFTDPCAPRMLARLIRQHHGEERVAWAIASMFPGSKKWIYIDERTRGTDWKLDQDRRCLDGDWSGYEPYSAPVPIKARREGPLPKEILRAGADRRAKKAQGKA